MGCGKAASTGGVQYKGMHTRRTLIGIVLFSLGVMALSAQDAVASDEKKKDTTTFVAIATVTATVLSPGGRNGVMTVQTGVDVPDPVLHALTAKVQPRLRDAYTQELQAYAGGLGPGRPPDADYVARRLQLATDHVLGRPGGHLLLTGIMVN
jgi:hypothetical protein